MVATQLAGVAPTVRNKTLTAYGSQVDQDKLAVLAEQSGETASTWIIKQIRDRYAAQYGDTEPHFLRKSA